MRHFQIATAIAVALSCVGHAMAADRPPAFATDDLAALEHVPIHVIARQDTVRPQVAYRPVSISVINSGGNYPGMSTAGSIGVNVAGGLIASALINASEREAAYEAARTRWNWMQTGQCTVDAAGPVHEGLVAALQAAGLTGVAAAHVQEARDLDEIGESDRARLVVQHSTSLTPDLGVLLTTVTAEAWAVDTARRDGPLWLNRLVIASSPLNLPDKTDEDTAMLIQGLDAAYAASGNEERVRRINAAGHKADPTDRRTANDTISTYKRQTRTAKRAQWTVETASARRGLLWSAQGCAALRQAVADNAGEASRLLQHMLSGSLPSEGPAIEAPAFVGGAVFPGVGVLRTAPREVVLLEPNVHLSRMQGADVLMAFAYRVLEADEAGDADRTDASEAPEIVAPAQG